MKYLYAPWRTAYTTKRSKDSSCAFCHKQDKQNDEKSFIIAHYNHCFVMLNLFPYNPGHVMVIPYRHIASLTKLTQEERAEIMEVATLCTSILKRALKTQGFNIGANFGGKAAGGSIPRHLHVHVLPRWTGDTSFLTTLAETKQIAIDLPGLYQKLRTAFQKTR